MLPMNFKEHQLYTEKGRKKPASSYLAGCDPSRPSFHPQRATATRPRSWYFTRLPFLGEQSLDCVRHAWTWIKEALRCSSKELCCECFGLLSWSWSLQAFGRGFGGRNQSCPFLRNEHDENAAAALKPCRYCKKILDVLKMHGLCTRRAFPCIWPIGCPALRYFPTAEGDDVFQSRRKFQSRKLTTSVIWMKVIWMKVKVGSAHDTTKVAQKPPAQKVICVVVVWEGTRVPQGKLSSFKFHCLAIYHKSQSLK